MLVPKSDFIGLEGVVHLATGGQPPLLAAHRDAFERYARDKARGYDGYWAHWAVADRVRGSLGALTGLEPASFALVGSASAALARVVSAFRWRAGENVVTTEVEYASGRYAFARLGDLGVEPRLVPARSWQVDVADIVAACDVKTKLVYVSQVSYLTGQHLDMAALSLALRQRGIALVTDVSHALGVVPVNGALSDFLVCCGYKWLLGTHTGILGWNRASWRDFQPLGVGWSAAEPGPTPASYVLRDDARRAEVGNANHLDVYLLDSSLDYLQAVGIERIGTHARDLGGVLRAGLIEAGLMVTTPQDASARAGNICFVHGAPEAFMRRAAEDGILVWADNGRVRLSVHLFVEPADIEIFLRALPGYLRAAA